MVGRVAGLVTRSYIHLFEAGAHIAPIGLDLLTQLRIVLSFCFSRPHVLSSSTGMCHHIQLGLCY